MLQVKVVLVQTAEPPCCYFAFITLSYNVLLTKDGATDHNTSRLHAFNKTILVRL